MPLPTTISPDVRAVVVGHLAPHFLTGTEGDPQVARNAANDILASYKVETEAELAVAAEIISLSFQALKALGQAADPDLPLTKVLRLRGGAVSLSRESHKARRRLDQLQRTRLAAVPSTLPAEVQPMAEVQAMAEVWAMAEPAPPAEGAKDTPSGPASPSSTLIQDTPAPNTISKSRQPWTFAQQQRHAAQRMTDNLKRNQAEHVRREAAKISAAQPGPASQSAA